MRWFSRSGYFRVRIGVEGCKHVCKLLSLFELEREPMYRERGIGVENFGAEGAETTSIRMTCGVIVLMDHSACQGGSASMWEEEGERNSVYVEGRFFCERVSLWASTRKTERMRQRGEGRQWKRVQKECLLNPIHGVHMHFPTPTIKRLSAALSPLEICGGI